MTETPGIKAVTLPVAAEILGYTVSTLRKKCEQGLISHYRGGGKIYFSKEDLNAYMMQDYHPSANQITQQYDKRSVSSRRP